MINLDFDQLKDLPISYLSFGVLVFLIKWLLKKIDEKDEEIKGVINKFLVSLSELSENQKETKKDIKELKEEVKTMSNKIK